MDLLTWLQLLAWLAIGLVMVLFACTGGFDLGAGAMLPIVARNNNERRVVVNILGPTWDGNQVWLIIVGGALFAIWPRVYAASFSGFYFAILLVLWALFLRPVAFEYRSKFKSQAWRSVWDWALFSGSILPALLIGVAVGNVILGVPFHYDPVDIRFFYDGSFWGLLRPFALLCGVFSVAMMMAHGASYLMLRSEGVVYQRCKRVAIVATVLFIVLFIIAGLWLAFALPGYHLTSATHALLHQGISNNVSLQQGGWMQNYSQYPWMVIAPIITLIAALAMLLFTAKNKSVLCFTSTVIMTCGAIFTFGLSLFPFVLPSNNFPAQSLLLWNASSSQLSLLGILICAIIFLPIIFIYTTYVYRKLWGREGKMSVNRIKTESKDLY